MATDALPVKVVKVSNEGELLQALAIREVVFIEEQHVPQGIERDAEDATAYHVLAIQGGHAVGTGRLWMLPKPPEGQQGTWAQIGRMAVLKHARLSGTGRKLLVELEAEGRRRGVHGFMLHAQMAGLEFYKKMGYQARGEVFEEAGIPHIEMHKPLSPVSSAQQP